MFWYWFYNCLVGSSEGTVYGMNRLTIDVFSAGIDKGLEAQGKVAGLEQEDIPIPTENTNILLGMQCPSCGSYGPFCIRSTVTVEVSDDRIIDIDDDVEWDGYSYCVCRECDYDGVVANFRKEE